MSKSGASKFFTHVFLAFYAVISLYPLIWLFLYSFKDNTEIFVSNPFGLPFQWRGANYVEAVTRFNIMAYFNNSMIVAAATILLVILCTLMFCYVIARMRTSLTRSLHATVMAGMFIPIQAVMIPLVIMVRRVGITNSLWSVIVPYTALGFPFASMVLYGFYLGIPFSLEESAYLDGASFGRTYFSIIFPQMKTPVCVLAIYEFMSCWNEFSLAKVLLTKDAIKKSRWRVEYKQYADRKLVAELVAVSEIGSRCTLRLFCFWEQRKAPAFARELKCQA